MALAVLQFDLSDATLSNGARLVASGSGLPQRVTTAAAAQFDSVCTYHCNPVFDSAGNWWVADMSSTIKKRDVAGNVLQTISGVQVMNIDLDNATGKLYAAVYGSQVLKQYDAATGSVLHTSGALGVSPHVVARPGNAAADLVWYVAWSSGSAIEYDMAAGAATGRTIAGSFIVGAPDATGLWLSNGSTIQHFRQTDLVNDITIARAFSGSTSAPGDWYNGMVDAIGVGADSKVYSHTGLFGHIERFSAAGTWERKALAGIPELDGSVGLNAFASQLGFSADGNYLGMNAVRSTNSTATDSIRIIRTNADQRARFSHLFASAVTIQQIMIPGSLGIERNAGYDNRKTRCYYSTDGGSTRTEFTPGTPLSLAITAGQTLTIDADMTVWGTGTGTGPFIGGDAGEGPTLLYEDPAATVYVQVPVVGISGSAAAVTSVGGVAVVIP